MKQLWISLGRAFGAAGILLGLVDGLILLLSREMFFDGAELGAALLYTLAMDAAIGLIAGFCAFGVAAAFNAFVSAVAWKARSWNCALTAAALLVGPAVFVLLKLSSGPQASAIPGRVPLVLALGALAALGGGVVLAGAPIRTARFPTRRRKLAAVYLVLAIGALAADTLVLVRLYPLFHGVLSAVSMLFTGLGIAFAAQEKIRSAALHAALFGVVLALGGFAAAEVFHTQNIRFVIGDVTPTAAEVALRMHLLRESKSLAEGGEDTLSGPASMGNALSLPGADVFLITVDAMRFDRLKAMGAKRSVAPNIDRFAETAVLFERAYTPIPHTSYALTSMLTGKYIRPLFDVPGAPAVHETWPQVMKRFRYDTAAFFTPAVFFIDRARFEPYLRSGVGFAFRKAEAKHTAEERTATLMAYLAEKKDSGRPLFAWVHYFEPHEPYEPTCTHFGDSPEDRYDCEIWTVDKALGDLLAYIDKTRQNAVVIITADHGEEFGDHGGAYHGTTLFDEQVRVPLLMRIPGVEPRRVSAPVGLTDLMGTVLRIVDIPCPARIRSRDLTSVILTDEQNIAAFSEVHDDAMVVYEGYKAICKESGDLCRLYDLKKDPQESRSVAKQNPERTEALKKRLFAWRRSHARYELRPVSTAEDGEKWPPSITRALGGDLTVLDDLLAVVATSHEGTIRRKAAELAFRIADGMPMNLPLLPEEPDVEVAAWLNALKAKFGDKDAASYLARETGNLDPRCEAFRAAVLVRASLRDAQAYDQLLTVALDDAAAMETRAEALQFIGNMERRASAEQLLPLIDNYQLTLDAARTLGRLKIKAAVEPLAVRLKRERFLERKAVLISALADIGDWRAVTAVTDELYNETPPPDTLAAISRMTDKSPFGRRLPSDVKGRETVFYRPVSSEPIRVFLKSIGRVVLRVTASADGGSVKVSCGGVEMGSVPLTVGASEGVVDLSSCEKTAGKPVEIAFQTDTSSSNQTTLEMAAILGK